MLKLRMGQTSNFSVAGGGSSRSWRPYSGHSDNDLPHPHRHVSLRGPHPKGSAARVPMGTGSKILSPDREGGPGAGDSDVESLVSFVSGTSALSTQSERPSAYVKRSGYVSISL